MTFEQWELSTRIALSDRGLGHDVATPIIDEARAHHAATGEDPREAFGTPDEVAAATAAEAPAHLRQEVDRDGLTVADHFTGGFVHLAGLLLLASVFFAVLDGTLSFPVSVAVLVGVPLLALGMVSAGSLPGAVRAAGRPHWARFGFVGAGVLAVAAGTAFTLLPSEPVGRVPVLLLVVVAVAALALLLRTPKPRAGAQPPSPPAAAPLAAGTKHGSSDQLRDSGHPADGDSVAGGASVANGGAQAGGVDRETWLRRLDGLLVGRHDLPAERAAELTREARAHLDASGAAPDDEFGPLAGYARRLAEHEPVRREPWWRRTPAQMASLAIGVYLGVSAFLSLSADGHRWAAYLVAVPVTAALAWQLITTARSYRRGGAH